MKKLGTIFLVVLLAMFICSCGTKQAVQRENPDFRNVKWGDSSEIVKQYETETELSETSAGLIGAVRVENLDAWLIYTFDGSDTLHTAVYILFNKIGLFRSLWLHPSNRAASAFSIRRSVCEIAACGCPYRR